MDIELVKILLASTLVSGVVSAYVSYLISLRLKKLDFKNEYFKEILKKRLHAYEFIEKQIAVLKVVVLGNDGQAYHMIFDDGETKFLEFQKNLLLALSYSLWIDDNTTTKLEELNNLFFKLNNKVNEVSKTDIIEIGKLNYNNISNIRFDLENTTKKGLYNLHDIKKAFRPNKKKKKRIIYK